MRTKPLLILCAALAISAATAAKPVRVQTFERASLLRGDFDRDGVSNSADPCWFSRSGSRTRVPGCTRLDVSQLPDALAERLPGAMNEALRYLDDDRQVDEIAGAVRRLARSSGEAVERVRSGNLCGGAHDYAVLEAEFESIAGMFVPLLRTAAAAITVPGDRQGDVRAVEQRVSELEFLQAMVAAAASASGALAAAVQDVCANASPGLTTRGVVEAVDDSTRRVFLRDGRTFASTPDARRGDFSAGQRVSIQAIDLGDSTGIATGITPEITFPVDPPNLLPCMRLTVAPIQPFPPISNGPFVQHDLVAYEYASFFPGISQVIRLEEGMRLGARRVCPESGSPFHGFARHSLAVFISYVSDTGWTKKWDSGDLTPSSTPVALPTDVDPSFPAVLTIVNNVQQCRLVFLQGLECGRKKSGFLFTHDLHIVDRGSMCQAFYEDTLFNVDDRVSGQFLPARVSSIFSLAVGDGGTPPSFVAQGYMYGAPPAGSSYPFVFAINNQAQFAIHSHDFYPIHGADNVSEAVILRAATGVDRAAGLMWPRAVGIRNGRGYQYSCHLPRIVRDVVGFCPTEAVDAYYHMPFAMGVTNWVQGQGNLSEPGCMGPDCKTHANEYAYDMKVPCNNEIRAARGGRVTWVKEDQQAQVDKWCCTGQPQCAGCSPVCCTIQGASCPHNELWIRHQDDSIGRYIHMPKDGVLVDKNDVVRRGQLVGFIGNTGNSTEPHLHFEERGTLSTNLALFVAQNPVTSGVLTCYEPLEDQPLRSFNKECTTCPPQ